MKNRNRCSRIAFKLGTRFDRTIAAGLIFIAIGVTVTVSQAEDGTEKVKTVVEAGDKPAAKAKGSAKGEYPKLRHDIRGREEAAMDAIRALPNGDVKLLALTELAARWVKSDSASAWSYSSRIMDGTMRATFLRGMMPHLVKENPEQVLIKLEEGLWWPDQWEHIRDATLKVAKSDLDRAVKAFEESTPDRSQIDYVAMGLAAEIVRQRGFEVAQEFADRQQSSKLKTGAYRGIALGLMDSDEAAAAEFVEDIEDEELRRAATFGMVLGKGWKEDPQAAVTWASELAVDEMRRRALLEIAWQWSQSDQIDEVKALLENPNVGFDDRAYIEERLKVAGVFLE